MSPQKKLYDILLHNVVTIDNNVVDTTELLQELKIVIDAGDAVKLCEDPTLHTVEIPDLINSFLWPSTPQNHDFWENLYIQYAEAEYFPRRARHCV